MGPTVPTAREFEDARRREELDRIREEGRLKFEKEVAERVEKLRVSVRGVKGDLMGKGGLSFADAMC
jgi:ribosome recycling factor